MPKRFRIEFSPLSKRDLDATRAFDRRRILGSIETKLSIDPNVETKDKKRLGQEKADFTYLPPLWELKAGQWRVFYEVSVEDERVFIHAIREKPAHMTTAEVLNEADGN